MVSLLKQFAVVSILCCLTLAQANLPSGTTATGYINFKNIATPATPASGKINLYAHSTFKVPCGINDAGTISCMVIPDTSSTSHQFITAIIGGVISRGQPGFTDLSGVLGCSQLATFTGDVVNTACAMTVQALHLSPTPTLCSSGNYSRGIDANGNAAGCTAASGGGAGVKVNGSAIAGTNANFNDATPAPSSNFVNVQWQKDSATPDTNASAQVPAATTSTLGVIKSAVCSNQFIRSITTGTGTINCATVSLTADVSGLLPIANGGTATASPNLVAGTNVTISGSWPNQTINATNSGGGGGIASTLTTVRQIKGFSAATATFFPSSGTSGLHNVSKNALPDAIQSGDKYIQVCGFWSGTVGTFNTPTDMQGDTFAALGTGNTGLNTSDFQSELFVYSKTAGYTGMDSSECTFTGAAVGGHMEIAQLDYPACPLDVSSYGNTNTGNGGKTLTMTTTTTDTILVIVFSADATNDSYTGLGSYKKQYLTDGVTSGTTLYIFEATGVPSGAQSVTVTGGAAHPMHVAFIGLYC